MQRNSLAYFIYTSLLHVKGDFVEWEHDKYICHIHKYKFMLKVQNQHYSQINKALAQLEKIGLIKAMGLRETGWYSFYFPLLDRDYIPKASGKGLVLPQPTYSGRANSRRLKVKLESPAEGSSRDDEGGNAPGCATDSRATSVGGST